ncbi:MAG: hypothetical protein ABL877_02045 [Thiobacillus sp.]
MSISYQVALDQLANLTENGRIATQQELRSLASSVSVYAEGNITAINGVRQINGVRHDYF